MGKVRLDLYLGYKGELSIGDEVVNNHGLEQIIYDDEWADDFNERNDRDNEVFITSFADRENKGVQPVPDGFPVFALHKNGMETKKTANLYDWRFYGGEGEIKSWKPDYDKLLEMQKEHDSKQEKPIEELMINAKESKMSNVYTQEMKDRGELVVAGMKFRDDDGCPQEAVLATDLEVVYKIGSYVFIINQKLAMPYKSKEELELEEAKAKQVEDVAQFLRELAKSTGFNEAAKALQEKGMLAEIVLPLEGK